MIKYVVDGKHETHGAVMPTTLRHRHVALLRLQTREVSCAPESDPLVDKGFTFFTVDDSDESPGDIIIIPMTCQVRRGCEVRHGGTGKV
jgi:hypothetical protein